MQSILASFIILHIFFVVAKLPNIFVCISRKMCKQYWVMQLIISSFAINANCNANIKLNVHTTYKVDKYYSSELFYGHNSFLHKQGAMETDDS
jgi:hypothetical protein